VVAWGQLLNDQDISERQTLGHPDSRPKPRNMAIFCRPIPVSGDNRNILCFTGQLRLNPQVNGPKERASCATLGCLPFCEGSALPL
jgi:hypothetical protein